MSNKLYATVTGTDCEGEPFTEDLLFSMVPPQEGKSHYGTGYYMAVKRVKDGVPKSLVSFEDVRYAGTTDVGVLSDRFIAGWYGDNAKEVNKRIAE